MTDYLLHLGRNAYPFGVWRSPTEYYYASDATHKIPYGTAVMADMGTDTTWEDWIERLASKIPGPADQWDIIQTGSHLPLSEVLDEARASLTYGD